MLVPFISASASLGRSDSGARPQRSRALAAGIASPPNDTSRSPASTAATYDSGVRSPLAPTEPSDGMRGRIRFSSSATSRSITSGRTPECPRASEAIRAATTAAASSSASGAPVPTPCIRNRLVESSAPSAGGTSVSHDSPTPVVTP